MRATVRRGSSEPIGSWNTICTARRTDRRSARTGTRQVVPDDAHASRRRSLEPDEQAGDRRLPRARLADDADSFVAIDVQIDVVAARARRAAGRTAWRAGGGRSSSRRPARRGVRSRRVTAHVERVEARRPAGRRQCSRGTAVHASSARTQRLRNTQPDGNAPALGTEPGDRRQSGAPRRARPSPPTRRGDRRCTGGGDRRAHRRPAPLSTMRPPYITITRSHSDAMTARSWVMNSRAAALVAHQTVDQREHARLHRDVERRGRLVADQQARDGGPARWRARRAGAARPTAGTGTRAPSTADRASRRGRAVRPHVSTPSRAARRARWRRTASATCAPTRISGLSALIGSWNTMAGDLAAHASPARARRAQTTSMPVEVGRGRSRSSPSLSRPITDSAVSDFPQPDSPIRPTRSPASRLHRRCRRRAPCRSAVSHGETVDRRERHARTTRSFGSMASRSPSPSRLNPSTATAMATPGQTARYRCWA